MEYVHYSPDKDPGYSLTEEILDHKGKKILYLLTELYDVFVTGCGQSVVPPSQTRTIIVKGYIKNWKYKTSEDGNAISELEPVNEDERKEIIELIECKYNLSNIHFV